MHKTYKTYKTYKTMMGAPVFALTGYAVASHVIPRGFACRCAVGLWQRVTAGVMRGNLMAAGVCSLRGCDACKTVVNGG